ncbi:MAG: ABC transporter ATP-binding protein [Deltaproteobacteria bacterium]|nr:ABC transporter ATP-binding protein [Deltaproteobacteria bacterium]
MQAAEVKLENVGKRYGDQWVVRDVNLQIRRGEFYTFLGPSGCGKTTLLRMIAGFVFPDQGVISLDDRPVNQVPPWQRDVGMVFQNYALWPHLTVFENVAFGLRERKVARGDIAERVNSALKLVGLAGTEKRRPSQLSGGQQQRVALARTLVIQPRVLLLDEPLSNLDAKLRVEMRIELLKLQRDLGLTTIYVTHDQEEALAMSTHIAVMNLGQVVQEGEPRLIYEQPAHEFVAAFVGQSNLFSGTVLRSSADGCEIEAVQGSIIKAAALAFPARPGEAVAYSIRPEAFAIETDATAAADGHRIRAEVVAAAYQGSTVEYELTVDGKTIKARVANPKGKPLYARGDLVTLVFEASDVVIVPK